MGTKPTTRTLVATLRRIADTGRWVSIGSIDSHMEVQLSRSQVDDLAEAADRLEELHRKAGIHQLKRALTKGDVTVTETYVVTPYLVRIDSNDPRQGTVIGQVADPKTFLVEGAPPWVDKVEVTEEWTERIEL